MVDNKERGATWGKLGGTNPMHGKEGTGTQTPGHSSQEGGGALSTDHAPQAGSSSVIGYSSGASNKSYAGTQTPGVSAATPTGGDQKFAEGGKTPMFGNRGSLPAKGGCSAP